MTYFKRIAVCIFILFSAGSASVFAQMPLSSDQLFTMARSAAFEKKDYSLATQLTHKALEIAPDYTEVRIFLGRVYTWWDKMDSARINFQKVLDDFPGNADAAAAYADLEYWNRHYEKALQICNSALQFNPGSQILLLKKAKSLAALNKFPQASEILYSLLKKDYETTEIRSVLEKIKDRSAKNKVGVNYDFVTFDKQFADPWHIASVDYSRSTRAGSFIGRINYANRFKTNAIQLEADAYPKISKTFYAYVNAGISDASAVFPSLRAGFSLYANLPAAFEAEAGLRYLSFDDETWIYTASAGKYLKNYLFSFKTYLVPSGNAISNSYSLSGRYYYRQSDYFGIGIGTGISPDDRANNVQLNDQYKLQSYRLSTDYRYTFKKMTTLVAGMTVLRQEYQPKVTGTQYLMSIGFQRRF